MRADHRLEPFISIQAETTLADTIQLFKPWYEESEHEALRQPLQTGWLGYGPLAQGFVFCFVVPGFKKLNCIRQCGLRLYAYEGSEPLVCTRPKLAAAIFP